MWQQGINVRRWWADRLEGIEAPLLSTWDELAIRRWGPATGDPISGIVIDRPDRDRLLAAPGAISDDPYAMEERAAIMEFDGGLSRISAERAAGVNI